MIRHEHQTTREHSKRQGTQWLLGTEGICVWFSGRTSWTWKCFRVWSEIWAGFGWMKGSMEASWRANISKGMMAEMEFFSGEHLPDYLHFCHNKNLGQQLSVLIAPGFLCTLKIIEHISWEWWCTPVIWAMKEARVRGWRLEAGPGQKAWDPICEIN
jgi:hypothetical protein